MSCHVSGIYNWQGLNEDNNNQTSELLPYLPALMVFLEVRTCLRNRLFLWGDRWTFSPQGPVFVCFLFTLTAMTAVVVAKAMDVKFLNSPEFETMSPMLVPPLFSLFSY